MPLWKLLRLPSIKKYSRTHPTFMLKLVFNHAERFTLSFGNMCSIGDISHHCFFTFFFLGTFYTASYSSSSTAAAAAFFFFSFFCAFLNWASESK